MTVDQLEEGFPPKREPLVVNGRYRIPDPETGKPRLWTRATTWAETIENQHGLTGWKLRMCARGVAERDDLRLRIAAIEDPTTDPGKKKLNDLAELAKEHAGGEYRSNIGSALHEYLETVDRGRPVKIAEPYDRDIAAYLDKRDKLGLKVSPNYIEQVVTVPELGVAGKLDRLGKLPTGPPLILDYKTGSTLDFSWLKIAIQLALYSRGATLYDVDTETHHKMLAVNQHQAIVMHIPAGEGKCFPYFINLDLGWEAALECKAVRYWRRRRDLAVLIT